MMDDNDDDDDECGRIGGMIGRGKRSIRRKPVQVPCCTPKIHHTTNPLTRARTLVAAVGSLNYGTVLFKPWFHSQLITLSAMWRDNQQHCPAKELLHCSVPVHSTANMSIT
jgi:hypothetical protein